MSWKDTLGLVAKTAATAIGGPLGGVAVNVIAKALDVEPNERAIEAAITSGSPEVLSKLKDAELEFLAKCKELDIQIEQIQAQDRQDARARQERTGDYAPHVFLVIALALFGLELYLIFKGYMPSDESAKTIAIKGFTIIETLLFNAWAFFFGTSAGSKQKTEILNRK